MKGHPLPCPNLRPVPPLIRGGVAEILQSRVLLKIMFSVLLDTVLAKQKKTTPTAQKTGTEKLFCGCLCLLKLMLQFYKEEAANTLFTQSEEESMESEQQVRISFSSCVFGLTYHHFSIQVENIYGIKFPSVVDTPANICHEVLVKIDGLERKECVLSLLLTLLDAKQDEDLVDKKDAMEEIVALLQGLPFESKAVRKAKDIIREHERRKAAAAEEGLSEEELRLKRLRESKERQKAILAQFAAKQKQFLAGNQGLADSDAGDADPLSKKGEVAMEGIDIGVGATAEGDTQELETCVMCKEGFLPKDPLGRLAYVQTSGVLETARRHAYEARYGGQRSEKVADTDKGKGKEKEKEKEKETKGAEQGKADVQMQEAKREAPDSSATPTAMTGMEDSAAGTSSAPAEVAEGESAQSSSGESKEGVDTHALKERMGWLQEMTRNVTEGSNAHCFSCQHLMHVNCSKCLDILFDLSNVLLFHRT